MPTKIPNSPGKVVVIGAGDVGSTSAFALAQSGIVNEIALFDINRQTIFLIKG